MTDKKILDYIFKKGETEFTEDELKFMRKIDVERKKRDCPFKSGEPYDYMAIGIYMGIKSQAVKTFQEELNKGFDVLSKMGDYTCKSCPGFKGTKEEMDAVVKSVRVAIFRHGLKIFFKTVFQVCLGTAALFLIIYVSMGCFFLVAGI